MTRPSAAWAPPQRDGVAASRVAVQAGPWPHLAAFLAARLPAATDWPARLARGEVLDARGQPVAPDAPCTPGAVLWYWRSPPPEHPVPEPLVVLHRCEHLVAVDKPHFMSATPGGRHLHETALVHARRLTGLDTLAPMHRLDRETAGVMLFIVQPHTRGAYLDVLRQRRARKVYDAVAPWRPDLAWPTTVHSRLEERPGADFMQMHTVPGEPNARTHLELVRRLQAPGPDGEPLALYRLHPFTGRKHQLRVHLCALGLPIVGDRIYPRLWPQPAADAPPDFANPLQLLAREIAFDDPLSGEPRRFLSRRRLAAVPD